MKQKENAPTETAGANNESISNCTVITAEFKSAVLARLSAGTDTYEIAQMLLSHAGATVLEILREVGTTAGNQRISEIQAKHGIHVDGKYVVVPRRGGKSSTVKRHWIRPEDQAWWDYESNNRRVMP